MAEVIVRQDLVRSLLNGSNGLEETKGIVESFLRNVATYSELVVVISAVIDTGRILSMGNGGGVAIGELC